MSNYPFDTFPLTKRVGIVNPVANLDARYGPWPTFNDALTGFSSAVRHVGLTVAVSGAGGITEYWYKNGIADNNLVLKTVEETGFKSLSGKYEDVSTAFIANSANYILDGGNTKSAALSVGTTNNFGLILETNNISRVTITSAGNVGIGITNPVDKLEVDGTLKITGTLPSIHTATNRFSVNEIYSPPQNEAGMVSQFSSGPYIRSVFAVTHTGVNTSFFGLDNFLFTIGGESNTDIRFAKNLLYGDTDILNSGTEVMRVKASNSSVGIGTASPNERLTVVGNISSTNTFISRFGNSNQWQDNYTFTQTNSGNWQQKVLILPSNLPANTVNTFSVTEYGVAYQTVSNDQFYTFTADFTEGRTLTLFISGNHQSIKRHRITFSGPFNLQINGSGQSNMFYTFNKHTTKVTLTRLTGALNTNFLGTAEIIRTDLNENQGGLGFVTLETITGPTDFLLQEDGDRLVIRNFT